MEKSSVDRLAGWMVFGLIVVGFFGLVCALLAFLNEFDYVGTGLCLLASAYAFGRVLRAYR